MNIVVLIMAYSRKLTEMCRYCCNNAGDTFVKYKYFHLWNWCVLSVCLSVCLPAVSTSTRCMGAFLSWQRLSLTNEGCSNFQWTSNLILSKPGQYLAEMTVTFNSFFWLIPCSLNMITKSRDLIFVICISG